jgi:hypothetical protein
MDAADLNLVEALMRHVNIIFASDSPANVGRERELANISKCTALAEKIVKGTATDHEKARVADLVHPQVRSTYRL